MKTIDTYLEIGAKRVFAGSIDWPGWCRSGANPDGALDALLAYAPRYAHLFAGSSLVFDLPGDRSAFRIVEQVEGNKTTDFGAPNIPLTSDRQPFGEADYQRFRQILQACWAGFDAAVASAAGRTLRTGPRGGGRDREGIINHVIEADLAYLSRLGWKHKRNEVQDLNEKLAYVRQGILAGLEAAVRGELPTQGPRGGVIWAPRTFIRRTAWHVLDHAWEIEDRIITTPA